MKNSNGIGGHARGKEPRARESRRGFTLIELLAVIAVILVLLSLVVPVLGTARKRAMLVPCASNLRQLYTLCIGFASDNAGVLPQGLSENPEQLNCRTNYTNFAALNKYMQTYGYPPNIWYCPSFPSARFMMTAWADPNWYSTAYGTGTPGEFPIGYCYVANVTAGSIEKFKVPPPSTLNDLSQTNAPFIWDYCRALRPSPIPANQVADWDVFPHYDLDEPTICQMMLASGGVIKRKLDEMQQRYDYWAPYEIYW